MNYLATLRHKDIFPQPIDILPTKYEKRVTVKAIVKDKMGKYGFVTSSRHGFYLLAGGGAENEDLTEEIKRECAEELGHEIEIIKEVGRIREFRDRDAKEYETTCFLAETRKKTNEDLRTEDEKRNNLSVVWLECDNARKILEEQAEKVRMGEVEFYNIAFNIIRDQIFFEEVMKNYTV